MARRKKEHVQEPLTAKAQLSAAIKRARDIMRKDAGLNGDLDRIPQLSWVMFLKCFDDKGKQLLGAIRLEKDSLVLVIDFLKRYINLVQESQSKENAQQRLEMLIKLQTIQP